MEKTFRYEKDLVNSFQKKHHLKSNAIIIKEMKIRWGNIDLVEISKNKFPFNTEQSKVLSKPSRSPAEYSSFSEQ